MYLSLSMSCFPNLLKSSSFHLFFCWDIVKNAPPKVNFLTWFLFLEPRKCICFAAFLDGFRRQITKNKSRFAKDDQDFQCFTDCELRHRLVICLRASSSARKLVFIWHSSQSSQELITQWINELNFRNAMKKIRKNKNHWTFSPTTAEALRMTGT